MMATLHARRSVLPRCSIVVKMQFRHELQEGLSVGDARCWQVYTIATSAAEARILHFDVVFVSQKLSLAFSTSSKAPIIVLLVIFVFLIFSDT